MNFSEKFLRLRKSAGLSQEEVADRLGVSRQAVSRWEQGSALPDALNKSCICKVFGVSADYLINSEEDARSEIKAHFSDGARAESGAAVAAANRGRNKRILYACTGAHIPALAAELIVIICFICSAKTAFYVLLSLGVMISVCAVTAFEVLFSDKESDVRTFYRKKILRRFCVAFTSAQASDCCYGDMLRGNQLGERRHITCNFSYAYKFCCLFCYLYGCGLCLILQKIN